MRIDAHIHLDGENRFEERMLAVADHFKVQKLCLSALGARWPRTPSHEQCAEANRCTKEIMRRYPDRILGFCYVNPVHTQSAICPEGHPPRRMEDRNPQSAIENTSGPVEEMEYCVNELGMSGIKLWVACHADEPCLFPVIEKAIELRVPVLQHTWYKRGGTQNERGESTCEHFVALAARYPRAKLIAAHVGGDWERGIKVIKPYPNVIADVCGSDNYAGYVEMAVRELGADRVVFGTDMPGRSMASQIGKVLGADISDADKEKILGLNMERLLRRT
jgi:predicted TIM-barrel fold metal-dependent hydrolase